MKIAAPPRRRALLFGLNYVGTTNTLRGCENDVRNMASFLEQTRGFVCDVRVGNPATSSTAILDALVDLVIASYDDSLDVVWIHYSGHGTSIPGGERDGRDECLVPSDGLLIPDNYLADLFRYFNPLTRVVFVADCCHSGTIADFPLSWPRLAAGPPVAEDGEPRLPSRGPRFAGMRMLSISGCRDDQTSADAFMQDPLDADKMGYSGAMTAHLIHVMRDAVGDNIFDVTRELTARLAAAGFAQRPVLASCHDLRRDGAVFG
jgi:hypothetical protein